MHTSSETTVSALTDELRRDQQTVSRLDERVAGLTPALETMTAERDTLKAALAAVEDSVREQAETVAAQRAELARLKDAKPKRRRG